MKIHAEYCVGIKFTIWIFLNDHIWTQLLCCSQVQYVDFRVKPIVERNVVSCSFQLCWLWTKLPCCKFQWSNWHKPIVSFRLQSRWGSKQVRTALPYFGSIIFNIHIEFHFCCICYICYTNKNIQGFTGSEKNLKTEFLIELISLVGNGIFFLIYCLESHRSLKSHLQYGFMPSTNITLDHYSVQVVLISVVNLAQACCQFQGLMNLEVLKWHTPQDTGQ